MNLFSQTPTWRKLLQSTLILLVMATSVKSNAQLIGWPTSVTNITFNSTVTTDGNRARVITFLTSNSLDFASQVGTFTVGDKVIIIQMEGIGVGTHEMLEISSISGTTLTFTTNFVNSYSVLATQVIKIPVYNNVTLVPGGMVTCDAYSTTTKTGGVLCMIANTITFSGGGTFNVTGKGYPQTANPSMGGVGGAAAATLTGTGNPRVTALPPHPCSPLFVVGGNMGTDGGAAPNNGGAASYIPSSASTLAGPLNPTRITIGNCGVNGTSAGTGGSGGGYGGAGGSTNCPGGGLTGGSGSPGTNGGNGGDAGAGGAGGGIILIKIQTSVIHNSGADASAPRFISNGAHGGKGGNGQNGGNGGFGGLGAIGCCNMGSDYASGETGGSGEAGTPANAGNGGQPGEPGTVWLKFRTAATGVVLTNISVKAGKPGIKGTAGISRGSQASNIEPWAFCTSCPPDNTPDPTIFCDCDMAFYLLSLCNSANSTGTKVELSGTVASASYDPSTGKLTSTDLITGIKYVCKMENLNNCNLIFNKIKGNGPLPVIQPLGEAVSLTSVTGTYTWNSSSGIPMLNYTPGSFIFTDLTDAGEMQCYGVPCDINNDLNNINPSFGDKTGTDGSDGASNYDQNVSTSNPTDHGFIEGNAPITTDISRSNTIVNGIQLYPNPAANFIELSWIQQGAASIQILDLNGREIWSSQVSNALSTKIDTSKIPAGVYFVKITINNETFSLKFNKL